VNGCATDWAKIGAETADTMSDALDPLVQLDLEHRIRFWSGFMAALAGVMAADVGQAALQIMQVSQQMTSQLLADLATHSKATH
jgi:hypothetical protein